MTYLDAIYKLIKNSNLSEEEGKELKAFTDVLVINKQSFPLVVPDKYKRVIQKISDKGFLCQLKNILSRQINFDNTDLDDDVAGIH